MTEARESPAPASFDEDALCTAPGKLLVAGEYAVLERGEAALVLAVDRRVRAAARRLEAAVCRLDAPGVLDGPVVCRLEAGHPVHDDETSPGDRSRAAFCCRAAARTIGERGGGVALRVDSSALHRDGRKLGFGSSAAATVAAVGATRQALGQAPDRHGVFRIAHETHAEVQGGRGSGVDVAASTWGGLVRYVRPVGARGPRVRSVAVHPDVSFVCGWTGTPSDTPSLVGTVREGLDEAPAVRRGFIEASREVVHDLAHALVTGEAEPILGAVERGGDLLADLGEKVGVDLETAEITAFREACRKAGAAAKVSGAGGGDLAVAVCPPELSPDDLLEDLERGPLEAFEVPLAGRGVLVG